MFAIKYFIYYLKTFVYPQPLVPGRKAAARVELKVEEPIRRPSLIVTDEVIYEFQHFAVALEILINLNRIEN